MESKKKSKNKNKTGVMERLHKNKDVFISRALDSCHSSFGS